MVLSRTLRPTCDRFLPAGFIYGFFTICLVWYTRSVQSRIPYAASNLKCAVTVLKTNLGLGFIALGSMMVLMVYYFSWVCTFFTTIVMIAMMESDVTTESSDATPEDSSSSDLTAVWVILAHLLILSLYWTQQVMKNVVRVTVSGVVGTWWFSPAEAASLCSDAVRHSLIRSTTFSFGSICFGSLIVAILQMLRSALHRVQNSRNAGVLRCIAMCILYYIQGLVEYFNKWAYVYVGLYGYGYVDAGKRVASLFKTRGWQTIIADNLVGRLLGLTCLAIGLLTGVLTLFAAFLVEEVDAMKDKQFYLFIGFKIGFFIGLILSGVFMGLILDAVDAVIVCYAAVSISFGFSCGSHCYIGCLLISLSKTLPGVICRLPMNCKSSTLRLRKKCRRLGQRRGVGREDQYSLFWVGDLVSSNNVLGYGNELA